MLNTILTALLSHTAQHQIIYVEVWNELIFMNLKKPGYSEIPSENQTHGENNVN